jgi:spore germination protein YaaH
MVGVLAVVRATSPGPAADAPRSAGEVAAVTLAPASPPVPGHEVYGYVPYWEMDAQLPAHVAATDLTTLALFSVTQRPDGSIDPDENGFRAVEGEIGRRLLDEAHARGTRVELVWSSFGSDRNRGFFEDRAAQDRWIGVLTAFALERGFDGVNVDVEGLPAELVPAYGGVVGRLREALQAGSAAAQVSVATGAGPLGAAMAAAAAGNGADRIFLMGYDYRTAASDPGATAPLDRIDGEKDLAWSLDSYALVGVPADRTILGLPLYGLTWPVLGPAAGSQAVARGEAWIPRRHAAHLLGAGFAPTRDEREQVEFFALGEGTRWDAVYYDSPATLRPKLDLANERGLAGAGFWAIGYERGLPDYTTLIEEFRAGR